MIVFPSTNSKFTVTFQGDFRSASSAYGYTRSRSMLRLKREDTQQLSVFTVDVNAEGAVHYYTDPNGVLEMPLRNAVNRYAGGSFGVTVKMYDVSDPNTVVDQVALPIYVLDGISYNEINAPRNKQVDAWLAGYGHQYVLPPNVMLNPNLLGGGTAPGLIVESNFHDGVKDSEWSQVAGGVAATITPTGARLNQLVVGAGADKLRFSDETASKEWTLEKPDYCADIVCCRWTSLTGAVRQHFFPIVAYMGGSDKQVSLVSPGDGYEVDKNAWKGLRCRLTGLTSYGYWYYMDMLHATDLHAVVKPSGVLWETEISSKETAAYCEPNDGETPQGVGFFNFDFTLKLRHYDTV